MLESTSLIEWNLAGYVPHPEAGPVFMHEGGIAVGDSDGELRIVMRTAEYATGSKAIDPPTAYSSRLHISPTQSANRRGPALASRVDMTRQPFGAPNAA